MERLDRRIPFFIASAVACFLLRFVLLPSEKPIVKNVPIILAVTYLVLAALFQLDWLSRKREANRAEQRREQR